MSPASAVEPDKVAAGVALLESAGYRVTFGQHAFARDGYLAGPDEHRAANLQEAFDDPAVAAVVCSRGGYGCARLLRLLDLDRMAASSTFFVGFSDVTSLHLALNRRGLATLHAPMPLSFSVERPEWVKASFLAALRGDDPVAVGVPAAETLVPGSGEGALTGGCLCLLCDSLGTPDALDCEGRVVLIEDVDENPHRVDAMLTHLLNAGQIQRAAGIVVGEMTGTDTRSDPSIGSWPWRRIVADRLQPLGVPTVVGYPFGHCRAMASLPLGVRVRLDADLGTLTLLEPLCA